MRSALARVLMRRAGGRVLQGPFRGMVIRDCAFPGRLLRLLLGTHELELHRAIEQCIGAAPRTIINCGAARGYYAIGLALRCPTAQVIAFETVGELQADIARAAQANSVSRRIAIRGACSPATLREALADVPVPVLVFVDIEGDELRTFDPDTVSRLAGATVLIETHDDRVPGTTAELQARFAATHLVEVTTPRDRTREALPPALASGPWRLLSGLLVRVMREARPASQRWLLFTPRERIAGRTP